MVKHHPAVTRALTAFAAAKRNQEMCANLGRFVYTHLRACVHVCRKPQLSCFCVWRCDAGWRPTYTLTGKPIATDVHTESTHKGIDALQDRFDDLEVLCLGIVLG